MRLVITVAARFLVALALALGAVGFAPRLASACACGAVVDNSGGGHVGGETALIHHDGTTEQIDMVLTMTASLKDAAWIMPTPQQTTLGLGEKTQIEALEKVSAPRLDDSGRFRLSAPKLLAGSGARPESNPTLKPPVQVDKVTDVGPFRVTTLSGSDPAAVNGWLTAQGYPTKPEIVPIVKQYLDEGWVIQAVKLVPGTPGSALGTQLTPLRMTFPTQKPIYPIRLSSLASAHQSVTLYVVSPVPMAIDQQAAPDNPLTLDFAGRVPASLIGRTGDDLWLNTYSGSLEPTLITADYTFAADPTAKPFQRVIHTGKNWGPDLVASSLLVIGLGLLATVGVAIVAMVARVARSGPVRM